MPDPSHYTRPVCHPPDKVTPGAAGRFSQKLGLVLVLAVLVCGQSCATASEPPPLTLAIQPVFGSERTVTRFLPLAQYLGGIAQRKITLDTQPNYLSYWHHARQHDRYDLILDDAHFTDYRIQKHGYHLLAKLPGYINYNLIINKNESYADPAELIGKRVATLGIPSIGALRLSALYPNPLRQPSMLEVTSPDNGIKLLTKHQVHAALLPMQFISRLDTLGEHTRIIIFTEPVPQLAISASPALDPTLRTTLQNALLSAKDTPQGQQMLQEIGFSSFEPADTAQYEGYATVLEKYWGY